MREVTPLDVWTVSVGSIVGSQYSFDWWVENLAWHMAVPTESNPWRKR